MSRQRALHTGLAIAAFALVVLVVVANASCAPTYFERGDVRALIGLGVAFALLLAYASRGDSDAHRAVGAASSAGLAALCFSTASIPVLVVPFALIGAVRLPHLAPLRAATIVTLPIVAVAAFMLPYLGQLGMTADQFRCP